MTSASRTSSGLKMLLLLSCWMIAGITAKDAPTTRFGLKNSSICLQVKNSPPYHQLMWLFNEQAIVFDQKIIPKYKDKVTYDLEDHSLCINKLAENDSGIYKLVFLGAEYKTLKEFSRLIVEETVPRPVMRMSGLHSNLSDASCNVTVNCSIGDEWVWSACDAEGCATSRRSLRKVNISVFTEDGSVVCRGDNNVSTSRASEGTEATCLRKPDPEHQETSGPPDVIAIVIIIVACVSLCAFAVCVAKRLFPTQHHQRQGETPAARITRSRPVEAKSQSVSGVSTSSSSSSSSSSSEAEACCEHVGASQPCQTISQTISQTSSPREESGSINTVYSVLSIVTSSLGKDPERHKTTQETKTSQHATLDEEEDINTLYSVLQIPQKSQHHQ
ncbi:SLAM family member 9-like [Cyclopterus lumpus]|uniref:SLAM family member 9-like n=1 Tax=Cyclopterus lumpus TaxID=8103 RepID=UPI001486E170|nr:SLAM family member 9-like [Cyclopterus lumpus]